MLNHANIVVDASWTKPGKFAVAYSQRAHNRSSPCNHAQNRSRSVHGHSAVGFRDQ